MDDDFSNGWYITPSTEVDDYIFQKTSLASLQMCEWKMKSSIGSPNDYQGLCFEFHVHNITRSVSIVCTLQEGIVLEINQSPMAVYTFTYNMATPTPTLYFQDNNVNHLQNFVAHVLTQIGVSTAIQTIHTIEAISSFARSIINLNSSSKICIEMVIDTSYNFIEEYYWTDQRHLEQDRRIECLRREIFLHDLEKVKFEEHSKTNGSNICSICLDEFEEGLEIARMPCLHVFHVKCIALWWDKSNLCPHCRLPMH